MGRDSFYYSHIESRICFTLVPELVTLNDLERRNDRYFALFRGLWQRNYVKLVETRPTLSAMKCRPKIGKESTFRQYILVVLSELTAKGSVKDR